MPSDSLCVEEVPVPGGALPAGLLAGQILPGKDIPPEWAADEVRGLEPAFAPMTKILVVEDEATIAAMLAMVLEDEGFAVRTACDGIEGLERFAEDRPDLIVTDYMMPRMDGTALIAQLRANGETLPIIMASAVATRQMADAEGLVVDGFLMKPYRDSQLIGLIRNLIAPAPGTEGPAAPKA